ncbi:LysR family transcriptional regulator [Vibrio sp. E150_011]
MAKNRFSNLDLNLLRVFKVLHEEKNMGKASKRLFVSQPAVSQSLQKLRHQFDDPLFVKVKTGLESTAYADNLAKALIPLMYDVEKVVNASDHFDPHLLDDEVTIAVSPFFVSSISGLLFRYFQHHAPYLKIDVCSWGEKTIERIESGEILFGINSRLSHVPSTLTSQLLDTVDAAVLVRKNHPLCGSPVTLENLSLYPLAQLTINDFSKQISPAVNILGEHGFTLDVGFRSEYPLVLLDVIKHSDMFMTTSEYFPIQDHNDFTLLTADVTEQQYLVQTISYYHKRHEHSALLAWLNQCFTEIFVQSKIHSNK